MVMCPRVRHEATISRALNQIKAHERHIFIMEAADTIYTIFVFKCALSPHTFVTCSDHARNSSLLFCTFTDDTRHFF